MKRVFAAIALVLICTSQVASAASVRVGTWNLMRLGESEPKSYEAIAAVAGTVDLLAVQEVMNDQGLAKLEAAIEARTREPWSVISSSPAGSARYKERYAFLTRDSVVRYEDGAVSYLDRKRVFIREPFSARFRTAGGDTLVVGTVHILYGQSELDRVPEVRELGRYWSWLEEIYPGEQLVLVGDFNLPPNHPAFGELRQKARPMITGGATTLSPNGGFASLFDNVFVARDTRLSITSAGVVNYPAMLKINHKQARAYVSDHAPIFILLGGSRFAPGVQLIPRGASPRQTQQASGSAPAGFNQVAGIAKGLLASSTTKDGSAPVHANRNSGVYHLQNCPYYEQISRRNLVVYAGEAEAQSAGYRKAGNCP
ncbi:endonuclease/exonuclease/phosphatase family protein [Pseudomonas aeruginosa]|uniref:endonuclease/exonuclease/phosphatase family protein n=1 Tax=Pseudomonas aeruginosa TaxID=287 RepID=UPI0022DD5241|nr:endonuclease/exonuclease/phosphatase family protein [Pseudomonas aeruginosa]WBM10705.1 endonuclease/exonuclease/phosphatase family protein [Pseudomonas aeruginosa]